MNEAHAQRLRQRLTTDTPPAWPNMSVTDGPRLDPRLGERLLSAIAYIDDPDGPNVFHDAYLETVRRLFGVTHLELLLLLNGVPPRCDPWALDFLRTLMTARSRSS